MVRLVILLLACSRTSAPPAPLSADPLDARAFPSAEPRKKPPDPSPVLSWRCDTDQDCHYDDPCFARACIGGQKAASPGCEKSSLPQGKCLCGNDACTLVLDNPRNGELKTGCKENAECQFNAADGKCYEGRAERIIWKRGGFCTCDAKVCRVSPPRRPTPFADGLLCRPDFVAAIPCKTSLDCSLQEDPLRPAASSKVPRLHPPIAPCKGGERDSVCVNGFCAIQVWKC